MQQEESPLANCGIGGWRTGQSQEWGRSGGQGGRETTLPWSLWEEPAR